MSIDEIPEIAEFVPGQPITEADAEGWLPKTCFKHGPPGRTGIELEFLVHRRNRPGHLGLRQLRRLFDELHAEPLYSRFTVEPGGQVELSSRPAGDLPTVIGELAADLARLNPVLARHGARLVGTGIDPLPLPPRYLHSHRYQALEEYLDRWGPAGRAMMRATASVQVNVEAGRIGAPAGEIRERWDLLHAIGPVLVAAFARGRRPAGRDHPGPSFAGRRPAVWLALDPDRCRPPRILPTESLADAWTRWVLDAPLAMVRRPAGAWTAPPGLTFRRWLRSGRAGPDLGPPVIDDLAYHLTTLFPPVRARGHLEVRYLDAQPGPWWRVPAAVVGALLDDHAAGSAARAAAEPLAGDWAGAAREGLADPRFGAAAATVLSTAAGALERAGRAELATLTAGYLDRRPADAQELPC